jgi:type VI secretion system secreted protein VgrG
MDPAALGKYNGAVGGQEARKAQARVLGDAVERFNKPIIHLDTPSTASFVTPASISLFSGQDTSVSLQGDAHFTSAHTLSSVSGQTTSLYTHVGGIKGIAANGPLSLRAHTDSQQVWADQDITVQSTTDEIRIQAKESITLTAGQSQILIKGGDITFTCPGKWTVKGASHDWSGGVSGAVQLLSLPDEVLSEPKVFDEQFHLVDVHGDPMPDMPYRIRGSNGQVWVGMTDAEGMTPRIDAVEGVEFNVEILSKSDRRVVE